MPAILRSLATGLAVAALAALGAGPQATAAASDGAHAEATCYGGAYDWDAGTDDNSDAGHHYVTPGGDDVHDYARYYYVTSAACRDINLKVTSQTDPYLQVHVCFVPSGDVYCNGWTIIQRGDTGWKVIASDVLDNTVFWVEFDRHAYMAGKVAH